MTPEIILIIVGSIFLLVGLLGGGIKIKDWFEIPRFESWWARVIVGVVGVFMLAVGFRALLTAPPSAPLTRSPPATVSTGADNPSSAISPSDIGNQPAVPHTPPGAKKR